MIAREKLENWWNGRQTDAELAEFIGAQPRAVQMIIQTEQFRSQVIGGGRGSKGRRRLPVRVRVGVAAAYALHVETGITLSLATNIIGTAWDVCDSIARTLNFCPPGTDTFETECHDQAPIGIFEDCDDISPLHWWSPGVCAMQPTYPGVDEYIDFVNKRYVYWVHPSHSVIDAITGGISRYPDGSVEMDNAKSEDLISKSIKTMEYEENNTDKLIGIIDQSGEYRSRAPDGDKVVAALMEALEYKLPADIPNPTATYRSKLSVNISVAARNMKRRAFGLWVVDPDDEEAVSNFYRSGGNLLSY